MFTHIILTYLLTELSEPVLSYETIQILE